MAIAGVVPKGTVASLGSIATVAHAETTTVVWSSADEFFAGGVSVTDGASVYQGAGTWYVDAWSNGGSFTTSLGNFTKIEVGGEGYCNISGDGWSGKTWTGNASSVAFQGIIDDSEGRYPFTVTFTIEAVGPATVDLSTLTGNYMARDGDTLTGTLGGEYRIMIADGATVTLKDASINADGTYYSGEWAGITPLGDATIVLEGDNNVKGFHEDYPGIFAAAGKTLTIKGTGSLTASSDGLGAGIGAGLGMHCGNIEIKGGNITAIGGYYAAGIGSAYYGNCGSITITDRVTSVTATKGSGASHSIGVGSDSSVGTVTIGGVEGAISESPYTYIPPVKAATATYAQVGGDYTSNTADDNTASLWKVTVTPGTAAITTLSVKVNDKTPDAPLSAGTAFDGEGGIVFGVVLNGTAADVTSFTALVNDEAVTTTVE